MMLAARGLVVLAVVSLSGGCGSDKPKEGSEKGACFGNGTCNEGLVCMSDRCVKDDGPAPAAAKAPPADKRSKKVATTEARQHVKKLYDGARAYYMDRHVARGVLEPLPQQFPEPSAGPTPPLGECCKSEGGKCDPNASLWEDETWVVLQFSVDDPHRYSYQYRVTDKFTQFTVSAYGDLDCDGTYSTFEMYGTINSTYSDGPAGNAGMYRKDELE